MTFKQLNNSNANQVNIRFILIWDPTPSYLSDKKHQIFKKIIKLIERRQLLCLTQTPFHWPEKYFLDTERLIPKTAKKNHTTWIQTVYIHTKPIQNYWVKIQTIEQFQRKSSKYSFLTYLKSKPHFTRQTINTTNSKNRIQLNDFIPKQANIHFLHIWDQNPMILIQQKAPKIQ